MENKLNEYALYTRKYLIDKLDFLSGEIQKFVPADPMEDTGVAAIDVKWESGVHFVVCQTLWWVSFYAMRNNEQISHTFRVGKLIHPFIFV